MTKSKSKIADPNPNDLPTGYWLDPVLEPFSTQEELDQLDRRIKELKQESAATGKGFARSKK